MYLAPDDQIPVAFENRFILQFSLSLSWALHDNIPTDMMLPQLQSMVVIVGGRWRSKFQNNSQDSKRHPWSSKKITRQLQRHWRSRSIEILDIFIICKHFRYSRIHCHSVSPIHCTQSGSNPQPPFSHPPWSLCGTARVVVVIVLVAAVNYRFYRESLFLSVSLSVVESSWSRVVESSPICCLLAVKQVNYFKLPHLSGGRILKIRKPLK